MSSKEKININEWKREEQYLFFKDFQNPYLSITSTIEISNIIKYSKENNISFYGLLMYFCLKTINEIDEFRYVIEENNVYKYDKINASFSVIDAENNLNFTKTVEYNEFNKFMQDFYEAKYEAENHIKNVKDRNNNKCYFTCMPWIRITSFANPVFNIDSITRICWGKYFSENNKYSIDLSIQVNHAMLDGYHVGLFYNKLQENINNIELTNEDSCKIKKYTK